MLLRHTLIKRAHWTTTKILSQTIHINVFESIHIKKQAYDLYLSKICSWKRVNDKKIHEFIIFWSRFARYLFKSKNNNNNNMKSMMSLQFPFMHKNINISELGKILSETMFTWQYNKWLLKILKSNFWRINLLKCNDLPQNWFYILSIALCLFCKIGKHQRCK